MKNLLYPPTFVFIVVLLFFCKNSDQQSDNSDNVILAKESLADNRNSSNAGHQLINNLTPVEELSDRKSIINNLRSITSCLLKGESINLNTLHYYCGLPDGYSKAKGDVKWDTFIYYYDREDTSDKHVAYVLVDDGELQKVGFNRASVNDHSGFQKVKLSDITKRKYKSQ